MANKDTKRIINSAKRITAEASQTLVNTATLKAGVFRYIRWQIAISSFR